MIDLVLEYLLPGGFIVAAIIFFYFQGLAIYDLQHEAQPKQSREPLELEAPIVPGEWCQRRHGYYSRNRGYDDNCQYQKRWDDFDKQWEEYRALCKHFNRFGEEYPTAFKQQQLLNAGLTKVVTVKCTKKEK